MNTETKSTPMSSTELTVAQPTAVSIIEKALAANVSPEHLQKLLDVRKDWEADEARKAFHLAVAAFQARAPIIEKGDKAYDKQYARMDRIWRAVRPITSELGLSVTWQKCEIRDDGIVRVQGTLGHKQGHFQELALDVPVPDLVKGQNKAQQLGSAFTYAQRYAFCAALGIVTGDDDDGFRAGGSRLISDDQVAGLQELFDACRGLSDFNEKRFWEFTGVTKFEEISEDRYADVHGMLNRKLSKK